MYREARARSHMTVFVANVFAYEGPRSPLAVDAGASCMLLEGFYGSTLRLAGNSHNQLLGRSTITICRSRC